MTVNLPALPMTRQRHAWIARAFSLSRLLRDGIVPSAAMALLYRVTFGTDSGQGHELALLNDEGIFRLADSGSRQGWRISPPPPYSDRFTGPDAPDVPVDGLINLAEHIVAGEHRFEERHLWTIPGETMRQGFALSQSAGLSGEDAKRLHERFLPQKRECETELPEGIIPDSVLAQVLADFTVLADPALFKTPEPETASLLALLLRYAGVARVARRLRRTLMASGTLAPMSHFDERADISGIRWKMTRAGAEFLEAHGAKPRLREWQAQELRAGRAIKFRPFTPYWAYQPPKVEDAPELEEEAAASQEESFRAWIGLPPDVLKTALTDFAAVEAHAGTYLAAHQAGLVFWWHAGSHERCAAILTRVKELGLIEPSGAGLSLSVRGREFCSQEPTARSLTDEAIRAILRGERPAAFEFTPTWARGGSDLRFRPLDETRASKKTAADPERESKGSASLKVDAVLADLLYVEALTAGGLKTVHLRAVMAEHGLEAQEAGRLIGFMRANKHLEAYDRHGRPRFGPGRVANWSVLPGARQRLATDSSKRTLTQERAHKILALG